MRRWRSAGYSLVLVTACSFSMASLFRVCKFTWRSWVRIWVFGFLGLFFWQKPPTRRLWPSSCGHEQRRLTVIAELVARPPAAFPFGCIPLGHASCLVFHKHKSETKKKSATATKATQHRHKLPACKRFCFSRLKSWSVCSSRGREIVCRQKRKKERKVLRKNRSSP